MTLTAIATTAPDRERVTVQVVFESAEMQRLRQQLRDRTPVYVHHQVYLTLRDLLASGRLRAGDKLPALRQIALFLHITGPTVKQALEPLIQEGRLSHQCGRGTFVV